MQVKTILSVIGVDQNDDDLRSAIELCSAVEAHLSVLITVLAIPPIGGNGEVVSTVWVEEREREMEVLDRKVASAKTLLQSSGISFDVDSLFTESGWADNEIGERARYVDLTLIGGGLLAKDDMRWPILNGALFQSPSPIFVVPKGYSASLRPSTVLVAWDSRNEASQAVRAAMEQLTGAVNVCVAIVDPYASIRTPRSAAMARSRALMSLPSLRAMEFGYRSMFWQAVVVLSPTSCGNTLRISGPN